MLICKNIFLERLISFRMRFLNMFVLCDHAFFSADPASVTSLTMNGLEVNGDHLIDEGEINISCSFDQGNPHSNFLLLSEQGKEMNALRAEKYLNGSLLISCHLDWPTIRCEGNGSNVMLVVFTTQSFKHENL